MVTLWSLGPMGLVNRHSDFFRKVQLCNDLKCWAQQESNLDERNANPMVMGYRGAQATLKSFFFNGMGPVGLEPTTRGLWPGVRAAFQAFLKRCPLFLSRDSTSVQGFHGVA